MTSSDFRGAMRAIAPSWQPREVTVDPALIRGGLPEILTWWPPGERHGYHVNTQGFLLGEVAGGLPERRSARICAKRSPVPPAP
jgi:hypothetical protein